MCSWLLYAAFPCFLLTCFGESSWVLHVAQFWVRVLICMAAQEAACGSPASQIPGLGKRQWASAYSMQYPPFDDGEAAGDFINNYLFIKGGEEKILTKIPRLWKPQKRWDCELIRPKTVEVMKSSLHGFYFSSNCQGAGYTHWNQGSNSEPILYYYHCTGSRRGLFFFLICSLALYQNSIQRFLPGIAECACTISSLNI